MEPLIAEIGAGVPASVLISRAALPHVLELCNGEPVRTNAAAWLATGKGAPCIAALVVRSGRYV